MAPSGSCNAGGPESVGNGLSTGNGHPEAADGHRPPDCSADIGAMANLRHLNKFIGIFTI